MQFYLGVAMTNWLKQSDVPMFVSTRRLQRYRRDLPRPLGPWALDSGGFTELALNGKFETTAEQYVAHVRRYAEEMGNLEWAAPQDWMCEPWMVDKTGLSVDEHQRRTVENLLTLRDLAPELPFIPVLQGWRFEDYERCIELYTQAGVDLGAEPLVGLGSVCRRQSTTEIEAMTAVLVSRGYRLHGFGVKTRGLGVYAEHLQSADSMAWSYNARRNPPIAGHTHKSCANCLEWALRWRTAVLGVVDQCEPSLFAEVMS